MQNSDSKQEALRKQLTSLPSTPCAMQGRGRLIVELADALNAYLFLLNYIRTMCVEY